MTARSERIKLRTAVAADLNRLRDGITYLRRRWVRVDSKVFESANQPARERRLDEYPENNPSEWDNLADWADHISAVAHDLAVRAREVASEIRADSVR